MQQLFFLCSTLIIATEAFPEDLPRILAPKKTERKTSAFSPEALYQKSNRFILGDVNVPGLYPPYLPYEAPLVPFSSRTAKDSPSRRANRLRSRRRQWSPTPSLQAPDPFALAPLGYSGRPGNSDFLSSLRRDLSGFAPHGPQTGDRNEYVEPRTLASLHSRSEAKKREPRLFKRRRLSFAERRHLNRLKNKNKRNTNKSNNGDNSEEDKKGGTKRREALHKHAAHEEEASPPRSVKEEGRASKAAGSQKAGGEGVEDSGSGDPDEGELPLPAQKAALKGLVTSKSTLKSDGVSYSRNLDDSVAEENFKTSPEVGSCHLAKLKEMLEQVQTLLKDDYIKKEKSWKLLGEKEDNSAVFRSDKQPSASGLKDKIDTAIPMLMQISEDLLKISNTTNKTNGHGDKANVRCSADGTWTSKEFGLEMTFKTLPNMMLKVNLGLKADGLINKRWSIQGLTLSKEGGPLILAAVCPQKRKIASFLGQCKICKENDIIFGTWTFYTFAQKFTDLWQAVEFKLDVLKKKT